MRHQRVWSLAVCGWLAIAAAAWAQDRQQPVIDAPLPPLDAARTMVVPDGFQVTLFAGEPDVRQPIGFCIDDRGRLWVAEAYNYPNHGTKPGDRILIFEDSDGDGRFDQRTVFFEGLNYVSGIEVGFGGAWVMSPPYFYFIPDQDGDGRPDAPPVVLLDGFGNHANAHNMANGFAWGPDGWLYGTHGRTNWSLLGKPGTPDAERVRFDGGVYRYHPTRHVWEPYADGTTNPWGIDWNDVGEAFICNCVNPHLFHAIYGAHYEPWRNRESSQFAYRRIPTIADHLHFIGAWNVRSNLGSPEEDQAGGGHAHCGTMIYLGDNWPDRYRNTLFTNNIHGRRINNDLLARHGSGYTASHGPDVMRSKDPWFMGVTLNYGPDGSVFVIDWSDTGECHSVVNTRRETGRIYKIAYGTPERRRVDVAALSDDELVALQTHRNDWFARHARRVLQERAAAGRDLTLVAERLRTLFRETTSVPQQLRALWALHAISRLEPEFLTQQLRHPSEYVRAWAARLWCDAGTPPADVLTILIDLAARDSSPLVRLHLASLLQRLPLSERWPIASALMAHTEDAEDDNLPLMIWYGIEPLVTQDRERFIGLLDKTRLPLLANHIGRRVAHDAEQVAALDRLLAVAPRLQPSFQAELLAGTLDGLAGRRRVTSPARWSDTYAALQQSGDETVRERALRLALIFDDPVALAALRRTAIDIAAPSATRVRAVQALIDKHPDDLPALLLPLVQDTAIQRVAIRGLADYEHHDTPTELLEGYPAFDAAARQDALQTLSSRPAWAQLLLDAVEQKRVPRSDLTAFTARQLNSLHDETISARVRSLWGELRTSPAEKTQLIANYKRRLTPESLASADRSAGRAHFQKTCANCHRFFGSGGAIGPDITGSQRTNLDYLLQTLVDPSAAVARDYQMQVFETTSGRVITGLVVSETPAAVTVQTATERLVVPTAEIETRTISPLSMMPEGMLQTLSTEQLRELFAYLMGPDQPPER